MANKSQAALLANIPLTSFIQNVASRSPAPGGGSVAALAGSLGAGLGAMVCRLTIGKKKYREFEDEMRESEKLLLPLRDSMRDLIDTDTFAFDAVMEAFALPKETKEEQEIRDAAITKANKGAAMVPFKVMEESLRAASLLVKVAKHGNVNSISDCGVAGLSLRTAFEGAKLNVLINIKDMEQSEFTEKLENDVEKLSNEIEPLLLEINSVVMERLK